MRSSPLQPGLLLLIRDTTGRRQTTDLAVGGSNPSRRATETADQRPYGELQISVVSSIYDQIATPLAGRPEVPATTCDYRRFDARQRLLARPGLRPAVSLGWLGTTGWDVLQGQIEHYGRATDSEWALCGGDFARSQPPPRVRRDGQRHDGFMIGVSGLSRATRASPWRSCRVWIDPTGCPRTGGQPRRGSRGSVRPGQSSPMSSFQISGCSSMNRSMRSTHSIESTTVISTPDVLSQSTPPRKCWFSPTTTRGMRNCRIRPLQYQQGARVVTMVVPR